MQLFLLKKIQSRFYLSYTLFFPITKNNDQKTLSWPAVLYLQSVSYNSGQVKRLIALIAINTNGSFQNFQWTFNEQTTHNTS